MTARSRLNGHRPLPLTANGQIDWVGVPPEMRFRPRADVERAFVTGPALVDEAMQRYGVPDHFSPEEYGHYAATSDMVYAAVKHRVQALASVPIRLYRGDPDGEHEPVERHPSTELLRLVNPHWTRGRLLRMTEWALCLWGEAFWFTDKRDSRGRPSELWWARPDRVRVVADADNYIRGFIYSVNGTDIAFGPDETVWLPYDNPIEQFSGLAPLAAGRLAVDTARESMISNQAMLRNGARISGIISPADASATFNVDAIEKLSEQFDALKGAKNAHRIAIMSRAAKFEAMTMSAKDAEYINGLRWSLGTVSRIYGVPPEILGDHERATYSNMDQAYKALWTDAIIPEAAFIEEELTEKYLPMFGESRDLFLRFDFSDVPVLQEDLTEITQQASVWIDRGMPLNDALMTFMPDKAPETPYAWGDVPIWEAKAQTQALYLPEPVSGGAGEDGDDEPPGAPGTVAGQVDTVGAEDPPRSALALIDGMIRERQRLIELGSPEHHARSRRYHRLVTRHEERFAAALAEMFGRQRDSVLARLSDGRIARDALEAESMPFDQPEWERRFVQMALPFFQAMFEDGAYETLDELGVMLDFTLDNPRIIEWLQTATQRFAQQVNETTWQALTETLGEGISKGEGIPELSERVKQTMQLASDSRAQMIARTETVRSSNAGSLEGARESGVVRGKIWLSSLDERVRETHVAAHGQLVGLEDDFRVGGATGPAPGDMSTAAESVNCRCTIIYELEDGRLMLPSVTRVVR